MFLNEDGQAVVFRDQSNLHKNLSEADIERMKDSMMLLSSMRASIINKSLKNWEGQIYSSETICKKLLDNFIGLNDMVVAEKTKPFKTLLKSGKNLSMTTVPIGENNSDSNVLFILEDLDEGLTSICIDVFDGFYDAFIFNNDLQAILSNGVDTLYIDDSCFLPDLENKQGFLSEEHFRNLVTIISPKRIFGLVGATIPNYVQNIPNDLV